MNSVSSIAQSGLAAAVLHVQVAANNIANAQSSGPVPGSPADGSYPNAYVAQRVAQSEAPGGDVNARVTTASPGSAQEFDPTAPYADANGMVMNPNVDFVGEVLGLMTAKLNFAANIAVMRTYSQMQQALVDIKS